MLQQESKEEEILRWNLINDLRIITKTLEDRDMEKYIHALQYDVKDALNRVNNIIKELNLKKEFGDKKIIEIQF